MPIDDETNTANAPQGHVASTDLLGLDPKRAFFGYMHARKSESYQCGPTHRHAFFAGCAIASEKAAAIVLMQSDEIKSLRASLELIDKFSVKVIQETS